MGKSEKDAHAEDGLPVAVMSDQAIQREKRAIMKNILLISFAFLLNFTSFGGLSKLQSSLHVDEGMGVINQSILYGGLVVSCLFLPNFVIKFLGHKWTIPVSMMGYILWMAANGYAIWATMIPASVIVGLCAAPLWTAQCSYFTLTGGRYAQLTGELEQAVVAKFFGIFFFFFQLSSIFGAIISSTVLDDRGANSTSDDPDVNVSQYCGINDCPSNNLTQTALEQPDQDTVWLMLGIYIAVAVCAVLVVSIFVDRLPRHLAEREAQSQKSVGAMLVATIRQLRHPAQVLLIPITMYSGFEQAVFGAEFTKSFVSCPFGIWKVGLVTLPFGAVNAMVSFFGGTMVKYTGRIPIFIIGFCVDVAIQMTLWWWVIEQDQEYAVYILSALWGVTDGIWQTQINALYGDMFGDEAEAAFANYRMWESLGFIIAFAYSTYLCTFVKLCVLLGVLVVGILGYFAAEAYTRLNKDRTGHLDEGQADIAMADIGHVNYGMDGQFKSSIRE